MSEAPTTPPDGPPGVDPVVCEVSDGIATVRFNRPEAMNALDLATKELLLRHLRSVSEDPQVRCVVLTGTGPAFCVGQDLREHLGDLTGGAPDIGSTLHDHFNPTVTLVATMRKPVVAALNGATAGAGAALAFAADFRVMADTAGINLAFAAIGLSCDTGMSWTLPRLVGHAKAVELLMLPRTLPASECLELGLAGQVVPAAQFPEAVDRLARRLASGPTVAYGAMRQVLRYSSSHSLEESLEHEVGEMLRTGATQDHLSSVEAFLTKQRPTYRGE